MTSESSNAQTDLKGLDPESRQLVVDMVKMLRDRLLTKEKILSFDKEDIFPEETIREMIGPDIGLQLLFIPETYGGMGGGARDNMEVTREVAKICLGICTAFFAIQLGADPLIFGGTEEQKQKWLGAIARGEALVAYAVTEPGAGSNLAALKTKADPVTDDQGSVIGYRINGSKQFISTGGYADFITLLAKTPEGPSFFVVEKGTEGFEQGKGEEKHGIRASNTSPLTFTDVYVPIENLIGGRPGQGMKLANIVFGYTRLLVAAMGLGAGEAVMEVVIPYAKERIQFGTPLSEKQGYTHKLVVSNAVKLEAARAYIEAIARRLDSGESDLQVEGSIAKFFTTETANKLADDGMQALGGYGYINEYEVEKIKRDVKITCIYEGTSEIQQNIISTFRWKQTRKTKGVYYDDIAERMDELSSFDGDVGSRTYCLAARALNPLITLIHNNRLTRQQYVMFALADMMTHVEIGASFAQKAALLIKNGDGNAEKISTMSRIFSNDVAGTILQRVPRILWGTGIFDDHFISETMEQISFNELITCSKGLIKDMDRVADILFER